jgi:hypothetical protein
MNELWVVIDLIGLAGFSLILDGFGSSLRGRLGPQGLNRLRKDRGDGSEIIPQRLKPHTFSTIYVRAEARTLQKTEFSAASEARSFWKAWSYRCTFLTRLKGRKAQA